jgi:hypothetical protein
MQLPDLGSPADKSHDATCGFLRFFRRSGGAVGELCGVFGSGSVVSFLIAHVYRLRVCVTHDAT